MKKIIKLILIVLLIILVFIQFSRPEKNKSTIISANDITAKFQVPDDVKKILEASCNDCHSNNTLYPWYAEVQPIAWWLAQHISEGKRGLNFSEYGSYRLRKQYKRFEDINHLVKNGEMPLSSYTLIHRYAILNDAQKLSIANWCVASMNQMKARYPVDSLLKNKISRGLNQQSIKQLQGSANDNRHALVQKFFRQLNKVLKSIIVKKNRCFFLTMQQIASDIVLS